MNSPIVTDPSPEEARLPNAAGKPVEQSQTAEKSTRGSKRCFALTLAIVIIVLIVTMPAFFYPGDNFIPRAEAAHFLMTGEVGIPLSRVDELGEFVEHGNYFVENNIKGRFFSKYGVAYTLLYLPPMALEKSIAGKLELIHKSGSLIWLLNLYNLVFATIIFTYLYRMTGLYSDRSGLRALFVLCTFFGTFLWYYLRCHAHDIFQLAAFLGFCYHGIVFLRRGQEAASDEHTVCWRHLLAASIFLAILVHMRFTYALLYLPLGGLALVDPGRAKGAMLKARRWLLAPKGNHLWALWLPSAVAIGLLLLVQDWKFESVLNPGYSRSATGHESVARLATGGWWTLAHAPRMAFNYLLRPGNANIFLHSPLFAVAVCGWIPFWRRHPLESLFCLAVSGCILVPVMGMHYEGYGYGPRYLLPALIVCSLPALDLMKRVGTIRSQVARFASVAAITGVLGWSCAMQVYVNSLPFFTFHHLRDRTFMPLVADQPAENAMRCCFDPVHIGLFHRQLLVHRRGEATLPAVTIAWDAVPEKHRQAVEAHLHDELVRYTAPNYALYWVVLALNRAKSQLN